MASTNGWEEWGKYVLKELERQDGCLERLSKEQVKVQVDLAMLKVKAGAWGALMGFLPALGALLYVLLKK